MTLESMVAPIPSELVMPFAGFLIFTGQFSVAPVIVASTLGSIVGSLLSYGLGMLGKPVVLRYGRYLLLNPHHLEWTEKFFERHGGKTIFISRFIPRCMPPRSPFLRVWPGCPSFLFILLHLGGGHPVKRLSHSPGLPGRGKIGRLFRNIPTSWTTLWWPACTTGAVIYLVWKIKQARKPA